MRVLILHASVGLGHRRAAEALGDAFRQRGAEPVWVEDALTYGSALFRRLYAGSYLELSQRAPALWAYYYQRTDEIETQLTQALRALIDRLGVHQLARLVAQRQPEVILCTHFLPLDLLVQRRRRGRLRPPLYCVVTDYTGHVFWAYPETDGYFVAIPRTAAMLAQRGVPPDRISVTGIPVAPSIAEPKDQAALRQRYQLGDGPVIALLASGLSAEHVREVVIGLLSERLAGTLVVVAGRSPAVLAALDDLAGAGPPSVRVLGFIDYLDDLVAASDLVITKAGGLIVSEVLARGRPLVLVEPIPGQEEWNADHVVSVSAGVQVRLTAMVPAVVANLMRHAAHRHLLEEGARQAGRPRAALEIADQVLAALGR